MVIMLMTLFMNKFTNNVFPTYFQFIQMPINLTKFMYSNDLNTHVMRYCHVSWKLG